MKKVTTVIMALTMLMLFALMSSCSETPLPTENTLQSENTGILTRTSLYKTFDDPLVVDLLAGQNIPVGVVNIWNDETNLYVKYKITDMDWCIYETHVVITAEFEGDDPDWPGNATNKQGNPSPGQFTYNMDHDCVYSYTETIPLTGLVSENLAIAAHAVVKKVITPTPYYASSVVSYQQGLRKDGTAVNANRSVPEQGLVYETDRNPENFFSLGFGGWIIVEFDCPIVNGEGNDIRIIEDTWGTYPLETAEVWASKDGANWTSLGVADNTTRDPQYNIHTIAEFDLGDLMWAKYIKVVDTSDPAVHNSNADGYDLNAVESLQDCIQEETAWADGNLFVEKGNWATWFKYTVCPSLLVEGDLDLLHPPGGDDGQGREATFEVYEECDGTISGFLHWEQTSGGTLYTHDITVDTFIDMGDYVVFSGISVSTPSPGRTGDRLIITVDNDPQSYSNNWEGESVWIYDIDAGVVIIN